MISVKGIFIKFRTPQWVDALIIPPLAYFSHIALLFISGLRREGFSAFYDMQDSRNWAIYFLPVSVIIVVLGNQFPQRRWIIHWSFLFGMTFLLYLLHRRIVLED